MQLSITKQYVNKLKHKYIQAGVSKFSHGKTGGKVLHPNQH